MIKITFVNGITGARHTTQARDIRVTSADIQSRYHGAEFYHVIARIAGPYWVVEDTTYTEFFLEAT